MPLDLTRLNKDQFTLQEEESSLLSGETVVPESTSIGPTLRGTLGQAITEPPDEYARVNQLSRQSGVPHFAVKSDPAAVEKKLRLDKIDVESLQRNAPKTSGFLADYSNAVIAQDDTGVLSRIESFFDTRAFEGLGESISVGYEAIGEGALLRGADALPTKTRDLIPVSAMPIGMEDLAYSASEGMARNMGINSDEELAKAKEGAVEEIVGRLVDLESRRKDVTPDDLNLLEQGVRAGVESLALQAPGFAVMLASGGRAYPMLAMMGTQTYASSYGSARAEGASPEKSHWYATVDAAIEVGTEILPTKTLEGILTGQAKGDLTKEALKFLVREMGTEQLATLGQSVNAYLFGLDEELENAESAAEMAEIQLRRQAVTAIATVVAGGAQATASTAIGKAVNMMEERLAKSDAQTQAEQVRIDEMSEAAQTSKLRERDPELFNQFIQRQDAESKPVFIDSAQLALYLSGKSAKERRDDPVLRMLDGRVRDASDTQADVQISAAEFMTELAASPHFAELRPLITLTPESVAPFRMEQQKADERAYIDRMIDDAKQNISEYAEAQQIFETVKSQLFDTGQMSEQNAAALAAVVPAWATAKAKREGKTVAQVYQESGLRIEGPQTGRMAELTGDQILSQGRPLYRGQPEGVPLRLNDKGLLWVTPDENYAADPHYGGREGAAVVRVPVDERSLNLFDYRSPQHAQLLRDERSPIFRSAAGGDFRALSDEAVVGFLKNKGFEGMYAREPEGQESLALFSVPEVLEQPLAQRSQIDTPEFEAWFGDSKVVDENGEPLVVYHGSGNISSIYDEGFRPDLTGKGMDQLGSGFYFTTDTAEAEAYQTALTQNIRTDGEKLGGSAAPGTADVYLSIQNPLVVPSEGSNLNDADVDLTEDQAEAILRYSESAKSEDESRFGDFFEEYWDGGTQDWMYGAVAGNYVGASLMALENDFFDGEATNFRKAVNKVLGYDGVVHTFANGKTHYVAWFPEQIKSATQNRGTFDPKDPNILNQFAGEKSLTADLGQLNAAKDLEAKGTEMERIRKDTGWHRGVDGMWRYEISDDEATLAPNFAELVREGTTLSTILDHPKLYAAYPDIGSFTVRAIPEGADYSGTLILGKKLIEIDPAAKPGEALSTLLHEVQHGIQEREGFASGGAPEQEFTDSVKEALEFMANRTRMAEDIVKSELAMEISDAKAQASVAQNALKYESVLRLMDYAAKDRPSSVFRLIRNEIQWIYGEEFQQDKEIRQRVRDLEGMFYNIPKSSGPKRNAAIREVAEVGAQLLRDTIPAEHIRAFKGDTRTLKSMIKALQKQASAARAKLQPITDAAQKAKRAKEVQRATEFKTPHQVYKALAGEIEARVTQARQFLTDEERKAHPPQRDMDVPETEAIVILGGKRIAVPSYMASMPQTKGPRVRGYYDPSNSLIRLTEASDLSTFLHEFAHFMYEQELMADGMMKAEIQTWFLRNKEDVAKEANDHLRRKQEALQQTEARQKLTDTPAFKAWFGDSKVVDENGEPLVVYRGQVEPFSEGRAKAMVWFSTTREYADTYAYPGVKGPREGNITPAYISAKRPFDFQFRSTWTDVREADMWDRVQSGVSLSFEVGVISEEEAASLLDEIDVLMAESPETMSPVFTHWTENSEKFADILTRAGYDSLRAREGTGDNTITYAVFKPEQIKSAIGNRGTFDPQSANILEQSPELPGLPEGSISADDVEAFVTQGTTGDSAKDSAIRVATHEQFARGFETYVMEGKAPSVELRNVFRKFASWLAQIYRAIKGDLKVKLDDDMRAVFDRLLATDDQIEMAKARAKFEPMFTDAAMAGMTEEQFAAYQEKAATVTEKATETLRDQLVKEYTRQAEKQWKAELRDLTDDLLESVNSRQVYVAAERLKNDLKLDKAAVKAMVGETITDTRGRKVTRPPAALRGMTLDGARGLHPDEAAALLGYKSGAEMLNDVMTAPSARSVAEAEAQAEMVNRHGDILNDGTIEARADEALANEERGELLLAELKALSRGSRTSDKQAVKDLARERISKLAYREIHPGKYRKAELAAAKESAAMLATGDREGAAAAKQRQVMNYYLGMAAQDARNNIDKIVTRMTRYEKKKIREAIAKSGGGHLEQIQKILRRFEFRRTASLASVDRKNVAIQAWMDDRIQNFGDGLVLDPAVLDESYVTHWKNVPFADLQGIADSVKNIEHVARYTNKINMLQDQMDYDTFVARWTEHLDQLPTVYTPTRSEINEDTKVVPWAMAQMTKVPFLASWLDGGERVGMSHDVLVQPFADAHDMEQQLWAAAGAPVMDAIADRSQEDIARHGRKIYIPEISDSLTGQEILAVALNTGNEGNLRKMLLGEQWANPDNDAEITINNPRLQGVLRHMTKSDWDLVQLIWDQMDLLYPKLADVHKATTGLAPPKVEAVPVMTPYGEYKGGYYPVKYDPNRGARAAELQERLNAETESMFGSVGIQASVNAGATNERTGYYAPIRLSLDVIPNHFQETIHYITHHDAVRTVNRLIRDQRVATSIKSKVGKYEFQQLKPWLNDIAKDGREAPAKMYWERALARLRFGATLGYMGFKVSTGLMQLLGLSNTAAEVGSANLYRGLRAVMGSTTKMQQSMEFAVERSRVMKYRATEFDREVKNAMEKLRGKRGLLKTAQEMSMKHIALIQTYIVDLPSWHAAYAKELSQSGDEVKAAKYADWVVENIQGSGRTANMAAIMRNQNEANRMFTMFMTFFSSLWNIERDLARGAKSGRYSPTDLAARMALIFVIPVIAEMALRGELFADDDDEETVAEKAMMKMALYPVASMPFIRDIASGIGSGYGYNISPIGDLMERGVKNVPALVEGALTDEEITRGQLKGSVQFMGAWFGIPGTSQIWATTEHLYQVIGEGEELTLRELTYGPERK